MKETPTFSPFVKVFKWDEEDWVDGQLVLELPDIKVLGFWVYKWDGKKRIPKATPGWLIDGTLTLQRPAAETWDGCVTVMFVKVAK